MIPLSSRNLFIARYYNYDYVPFSEKNITGAPNCKIILSFSALIMVSPVALWIGMHSIQRVNISWNTKRYSWPRVTLDIGPNMSCYHFPWSRYLTMSDQPFWSALLHFTFLENRALPSTSFAVPPHRRPIIIHLDTLQRFSMPIFRYLTLWKCPTVGSSWLSMRAILYSFLGHTNPGLFVIENPFYPWIRVINI